MRIPVQTVADRQEPFYDIFRDGVTQGLLGLFALCPQKARIKMIEGLEPSYGNMTHALSWGDMFHRSLDSIYCDVKDAVIDHTASDFNYNEMVSKASSKLYNEDKAKLLKGISAVEALSSLEMTSAQTEIVLKAYFKRWASDFKDFDWVDLERSFKVPYVLDTAPGFSEGDGLVNIPIRGKYDGVFRDRKGKLWLFETKTKSTIDDDGIIDKLNYDLQTMLYMWSMKHTYGETPVGVVYNVVRRPGLRLGKKEELPDFLDRIEKDVADRPDHYFSRYNASILPEELDQWVSHDFVGLMDQLWKWYNGEFNYRNSGACKMWNRDCEYTKVCAYGDRTYLKNRETVYPELASSGEENV